MIIVVDITQLTIRALFVASMNNLAWTCVFDTFLEPR